MKMNLMVAACAALLLSGPMALAEKCEFTAQKDSLSVQWTAYKTTEKLPVGGKFTKLEVKGKDSAKTLAKMIEGLTVHADMTSVDTANPARDKTLAEFFFHKLAPTTAEGRITHYNEKKGTAELSLKFNGHKKMIPLKIEVAGEEVTATGEMDILNFKAEKAFESLHNQCKDLHKGKDGVSKTWSTVNLTLKGHFTKACK